MTHYSLVSPAAFYQIRDGRKIIEPRLNDAAHQRVRLGDLVVMVNRETRQEVVTKVVGVLRYASFEQLFAAFPPRYFGVASAAEALQEVNRWCPPQAAQASGVVGVKVHVLR